MKVIQDHKRLIIAMLFSFVIILFTDITDIYACIVNLVEHSYGYDSSEILLTDTQVVHLMAPLTDGDYDTDQDNLLDRQELSHEENVNISNLLEEYINYNRLPEEEANKLRADPYIKMWAYKSNPALPDTDFDGRNDDFDIHRPLENRQSGKMSTLNYEEVNFDYNQDYRYFAMKPDQYYYDLSDMSMILANMVNKKSGINRRWNKDTNYVNRIANDSGGITTNTYRERYNAYSIEDYMNYIGLEDIEVRDMSSTYEDSNVCRYAIGHRDVVYSLGRTQNVVRNVIAISIGDIETKAAELYANFDGHAGREGSNTEYHHIGFDIVANRILETLERYASRYDPRYQKVYWITGEAGGGSVANLLAQKMIKKYGNQHIYCYTFQALNTINCNNIPAVQRISNEPYGSIFNLYNDDDFTLKIYTENYKFYKYGVNKHVSVTSNKIYKTIWNRCYNNENEISIKYPTGDNTSLPDYIQYFKNLSEDLSQMVYAFLMTEQDFLDLVFKNPDGYIEKKDDVEAYYQSLQNTGTDYEYLNKYDVPNKKEHTRLLINYMRARFGLELIPATQDMAVMNKVLDGVAPDQQAVSFGANNTNSMFEDDTDPRDGTQFEEYDLIGYKNLSNFDAKSEEGCVRIGEFAYSNYTLPSSKALYDVDYSKFWSTDNNGKGGKLFDYKIGSNIGTSSKSKTKFTILSKVNAHAVNNHDYLVDKNEDGTYRAFGNDIISIDDRLVAYFPIPVYSKGNEDIKQMHRFNNYNEETDDEGKYHGFNGQGGLNEDESITLNLIDVVFEKYEEIKDSNDKVVAEINKHQFVVPFVVGGTKWLHQNYEKHYAMFTDNRYGQIYENITANLDERSFAGNFYKYYNEHNEIVYLNKKLQKSQLGSMRYIGFEMPDKDKYKYKKTIDNTYPSKEDTYDIDYISPIEPVTINGGNGGVTSCIINQVLPDNGAEGYKTRVVSMRVYSVDVEEQIGENNSNNWKKNINQDLPADYAVYNGKFNFKYRSGNDYFDWYYDKFNKLNQIVKYPNINNSE